MQIATPAGRRNENEKASSERNADVTLLSRILSKAGNSEPTHGKIREDREENRSASSDLDGKYRENGTGTRKRKEIKKRNLARSDRKKRNVRNERTEDGGRGERRVARAEETDSPNYKFPPKSRGARYTKTFSADPNASHGANDAPRRRRRRRRAARRWVTHGRGCTLQSNPEKRGKRIKKAICREIIKTKTGGEGAGESVEGPRREEGEEDRGKVEKERASEGEKQRERERERERESKIVPDGARGTTRTNARGEGER